MKLDKEICIGSTEKTRPEIHMTHVLSYLKDVSMFWVTTFIDNVFIVEERS